MKRNSFLITSMLCTLITQSAIAQTSADPSSTKKKVECRAGFYVESMAVHGLVDDDTALRGKVEFGVVHEHQAGKPGSETVAYSLIGLDDPVFFALKDAYLNGLQFSLCTDKDVIDEMERDDKCATCTARGEIQKKIRIAKIDYVAPLKAKPESRKKSKGKIKQ